jgi:hypothetical protein
MTLTSSGESPQHQAQGSCILTRGTTVVSFKMQSAFALAIRLSLKSLACLLQSTMSQTHPLAMWSVTSRMPVFPRSRTKQSKSSTSSRLTVSSLPYCLTKPSEWPGGETWLSRRRCKVSTIPLYLFIDSLLT